VSALRPTILATLAFLSLACPAAAETATKEKVEAAIPKLEQMAKDAIAKGEVPGLAIAIVYKDEVIYLGGFGVREAGKPGKVDADTVFHLGSFSKPISATIVAALVSDGVVSWDSRIADLDPSFKLHDAYPTEQVTITDLFNHRSGLSGNAGNDLEDLGDYITQWNAVFESLFGPAIEAAKKVYGTNPTTPSPALPLSAYTGDYANDYLGNAMVGEESGGLVLKAGTNGAKSRPLTHFDRDLFIYYPTPEMPDMPFAVTFEMALIRERARSRGPER
jgi:CubicO group peptidase (beta-lactamase class C family)